MRVWLNVALGLALSACLLAAPALASDGCKTCNKGSNSHSGSSYPTYSSNSYSTGPTLPVYGSPHAVVPTQTQTIWDVRNSGLRQHHCNPAFPGAIYQSVSPAYGIWRYPNVHYNHYAPIGPVYANTAYGQPLAMVVPPTVYSHGEYSWGAPASRNHWIGQQFGYGMSGEGTCGPQAYTPAWPSHTAQHGVYYIRGPW